MIIPIFVLVLALAIIWLLIIARRMDARIEHLQKAIPKAYNKGLAMGELRMQPAIDSARHAGWNEGREYQIALEQRRHPRDPKTKQFVSRKSAPEPYIPDDL